MLLSTLNYYFSVTSNNKLLHQKLKIVLAYSAKNKRNIQKKKRKKRKTLKETSDTCRAISMLGCIEYNILYDVYRYGSLLLFRKT